MREPACTCNFTNYRDSESDDATSDSTRKIVWNTIVSSTATSFDNFQSSDTDAVHYVITGQKGSSENFICEATVVTDGTSVFVSQGPMISTKATDMLAITATISSGNIEVKASSTLSILIAFKKLFDVD